jgi:hypothetical protein
MVNETITRIKSLFLFREVSSNKSEASDGAFDEPKSEPGSSSFQTPFARSESYQY